MFSKPLKSVYVLEMKFEKLSCEDLLHGRSSATQLTLPLGILQFEHNILTLQSSKICMSIIIQAFEYIPELPFRCSCLFLKKNV